jgi:aryl-alcohol dehydrogenase-like predicted oxidoreductase
MTGVDVSALCLGTMEFGTRTDAAMSEQLLDQYVAAGGSFLDTANIYAHWVHNVGGESEHLLGRWMRERKNRSQLFLASKVGFPMPGVERGLRAEQIATECDKSLRRLGVETIDLYYAHLDDRSTPMEETLGAFERLISAGKIRYIGASNFRAWRLEEARATGQAHGWPTYCCIQQRYTYVRPRAGASVSPQVVANEDLLDYCKTRQVTLLAYSPLLGGTYTRSDRPLHAAYRGSDTDVRLAVLRSVAAECGATPNQVILAWMLQSEPAVLPVMAVSTPEQLQENLAALELRLDQEQLKRLHEAGESSPEPASP